MSTIRLLIPISILALLFPTLPANAHELNERTMLMKETGYESKNLTIHVGDTVVFKNVDTHDHWPASNIHPTHEIYPEFDPGKPMTPGANWKFQFTKEGEWRYHDHLIPTITGTITVEAKDAAEPAVLTERTSFFSRLSLFFTDLFHRWFKREEKLPPVDKDSAAIFTDQKLLRSYVKTFGPRETVQHLYALSATYGDCHQNAHEAGRFAYEFFKENAFQTCSAECHSGCYHGAIEAYFSEHGTKDLVKNLQTLCGPVTNPFFNHQCIHGIGHGLTAWTSYDIPEALRSCDLLPNRQDSCYTGVFMENIVGGLAKADAEKDPSRADHITSYLTDDPQMPCNVVDEKYKSSCYFYQTSRMVQLFKHDFAKVATACSDAPLAYHTYCFQSMGRDAGGFNRDNPAGAIAACTNTSDGANRLDCIAGAVQDSFWDPTGQTMAVQFCTLLTDSTEKKRCYDTIIERAPQVLASVDERKQFCQSLEEAFRQQCEGMVNVVL